jgi:hypothetical protein
LAIPMHFIPPFPRQTNKSQGQKRETKMKNILTNLMASAVLLFTIGGTVEAQTNRMQAAVPFAWELNGQHLNAGKYELTQDRSLNVMQIADKAHGSSSFVLLTPASDKNSAPRLVFHRYGNTYFLAEVVAPGKAVSKVPVSRAEKEAMRATDPREMATVFVDVKPTVD